MPITRSRFSTLALSLALAAGLTGCATEPGTPGESPEPARSTPKSPSREVTPTRLVQGDAELDADAKALSDRVVEAINANKGTPAVDPATTKEPPAKPGDIEWLGPEYLRTANPPKPEKAEPVKTAVAAEKKVDEVPVKPADPKVEAVKPAATPPTPVAASNADREALVRIIRDRVKDSGDPAAAKAMSIAALALVDPAFKLDEKELAALPPTQRELVKQFHELFSALGQQVQSGAAVDRGALAERLNAIIGEQPLAIRTTKLCERVRGFGVYEELPATTFLAGREQPMVVYVELDHFKSAKTGETFQVKLTQELILFNESDGLAVWRQPEEQIVDESRNQRRDFYTVQPTRLPARLGVGKYVLKVRVRDVLGGTRDEVSLPVNVVADPALVKPDAPRGAAKPG